MKIESRVAGAPRYIGSSTRATATTLPSAGAITNRSPRGPERTGSRKNAVSHRARSSSTTSTTHTQRPPPAPTPHAPIATRAHPGRMKGQPSGAIRISAPQERVPSGGGTHPGSARSWPARPRAGAGAAPRGHVREAHVRVVPRLGLRGGGEDRRIEPRALDQAPGEGLARERALLPVLGPGRAREVAPHDALERHGRRAAHQHGAAGEYGRSMLRPSMPEERRDPLRDLVSVGRQEVARHHGGELPEPEGAELGQHRALVRHRLLQDHVERAHAVAGDEEQRVRVHLVDLAHLATAQQRERQRARDERRGHTVTSAAAAAGAAASIWRSTGGTTSSRNSSTCWGARPT